MCLCSSENVQRDRLQRRVVVFCNDENTHEITFASLRNLSTSCSTLATLIPAFRAGGGSTDNTANVGATSTPRSAGETSIHRLFLRLHDVRQRRVTRFVEAQVGRDDRRQTHRNRLQSTVDFARDRQLAVGNADLRREGALSEPGERREHLSGLTVVAVDALLTEQYESEVSLCRRAP